MKKKKERNDSPGSTQTDIDNDWFVSPGKEWTICQKDAMHFDNREA